MIRDISAVPLRAAAPIDRARDGLESLCDKVGVVLLVLGLMHFFNLYVFNRLRERGQEPARPPQPPMPIPTGGAPAGTPAGKVID